MTISGGYKGITPRYEEYVGVNLVKGRGNVRGRAKSVKAGKGAWNTENETTAKDEVVRKARTRLGHKLGLYKALIYFLPVIESNRRI